jgi:hypothetical protein
VSWCKAGKINSFSDHYNEFENLTKKNVSFVMTDFRLYFRYIGISLRSQMEYRVSFVLQMLAHF